MRYYVSASDAFRQRRAQCLLMLDDGHPADYVASVTDFELADVAGAIQLFREGGIEAITG